MKKIAFIVVLLLSNSLLSGCIMINEKYHQPIRQFKKEKNAKSIKVIGFEFGEFRPMAYSTSSNRGNINANLTASNNNTYNGQASYLNNNVTTYNKYTEISLAENFRGILSNTNCFKVVSSDKEADLVLIGSINAIGDMSWHYFVQVLEGLTLTPIFGMPVPMRGSSIAEANIYDKKSGELIRNFKTDKLYLSAWLTIYSKSKEQEGLQILREMAMRDLAESIGDKFCNNN